MKHIYFPMCMAVALFGCNAPFDSENANERANGIDLPLELTGRVVDAADLLTVAQEDKLVEELTVIEQNTLAQLVVVTTPSLDGQTIEAYTLGLGNGWGIGDADRDDGLLLLLAPNERQVRIEIGLGLEETVTDMEAQQIVDAMIPHFSKSKFNDGIAIGVDRLAAELREPELKDAA
ncbi:MAG: TPM domain-containing protein [Erythrobacter sp.]|nr:TPM domain-containing protein [Erythrobacter sp.]